MEIHYNGTYFDAEISVDVKKLLGTANSLLRSAYQIALREGEYTNWKDFRDRVYEELLSEHKILHPQIDDSIYDAQTSESDSPVTQNVCSWIQEDDPDINLWRTSCRNTFYLDSDKPSDNHMKYCCYCGKLIKEEE